MTNHQEDTKKEDKTKERKKKSFFAFFFLCFVVATIAGFAYVKRENISIRDFNWLGIFTGDSVYTKIPEAQLVSEIKFDSSLSSTYAIMKNNLLECSNNGIRILNARGQELSNDPISMNSPVIKTAGEFTVVFDAGGKLIQVFRKGQKSWSKETSHKILNADISLSGYLSVVHDEERYRSGVTIFNAQGMEVFQVGRAEKNVIFAGISPSGKHIIYNSLDVNGVKVNTELEFSDIYGKLSPNRWTKEGAMFPLSMFIDDDLVMVGDMGVAMIGSNQKSFGTSQSRVRFFQQRRCRTITWSWP